MAEEAKHQVNECEKEIASIKARLKALGPAPTSEDEDDSKNSLTVTLVKVGNTAATNRQQRQTRITFV